MFKRGSVVLEVALIIGMFGAIATFASLHQEVARQEAQAQYAATASAQSGAAGTGAAAEKTEGDQELCKDGERYEVQISGTESSTNAQFKETSRPNDFMMTPLKKRPCYLTFSTGDGKQITVTVPNGGKLDEAYKPASLSAASDGYSSAVDKLKSAQELGDKAKIEGALEGVQEASKEYSQALDAAYADKGNKSYLKAKGVIADNNDLLSELTKNPTGITAEQVQTIQGGLSDIEKARISALGDTANVGHGFNTVTSPTDLSDPLTASKIGGLADTSKIPSFSDLGTGAASTKGNTFDPNDMSEINAVAGKLPDASTISISKEEAADNKDALYLQEYGYSEGRLKTAANQRIETAKGLLGDAKAELRKVECSMSYSFSCAFNSGFWSLSSASEDDLAAARKKAADAEYEVQRATAFRANSSKFLESYGGAGATQVVTSSISKTGTQVPSFDYGGATANTQGRTTVFGGQTVNSVNDLKSAITELNQLPIQTVGQQPSATKTSANVCPPGTVNIGGDCKKPSASGYVDTGGGSTYKATQQSQNPLSQLGKMFGLGGQQGGASAQGGSAAAQQACAQYPGTTLQNGQCTCPSGKGWNGSACVQSNPCAQYPGTTLQNNQCTCPTGQNWTGSKCEVPAGTSGGLKAELACAPQTQEAGKQIVISWNCENASTKRADGFNVDTANAMSGSAEVIATTTSITGQAQSSMQFALTCIKERQTHQAQCSVGVFRPFLILVATPAEVESGKPTRVGWITGGMRNTADACTLTSPQLTDLKQQGNGGAIDIPSITQETTFKLSCITQNGATKESEVTVKLK